MNRFIRFSLGIMAAAVMAVGIFGLVLWQTKGVRLYSVQDSKMAPALARGDLVVDVKTSSSAMQVGDIVTYQPADVTGQVITHRIRHIDVKNDVLMTQSDNSTQADSAVSLNSVSDKTIRVIPVAGYIFELLRRPVALITLVYLPAMLISLVQLKRLVRHYGYKPYRISRYLSQ